jgi:hypothetical protein
MAKFVNSRESISSDLLLWNDVPTQVAVEEVYKIRVWPNSNIINDGPIHFNISPQPKGMLKDVSISVKVKIQKDGHDMTVPQPDLSIINNFSNALWGLVDVTVNDRLEITQSMRNSYAYSTFFSTALNTSKDRTDFLLYNELFKMDESISKDVEESTRTIWTPRDDQIADYVDGLSAGATNVEIDLEDLPDWWHHPTTKMQKDLRYHWARNYKNNQPYHVSTDKATLKTRLMNDLSWYKIVETNPAANERGLRLVSGGSVTINSKLQCPLFNTLKCLPTNVKCRISLTKNTDDFLLLADKTANHSIVIEDVFLDITYIKPRDQILSIIEDRLYKEPAVYFIPKPEIIVRPITQNSRMIRIPDVFASKIPPYAFFCLQKGSDFEGKRETNPFVFFPFKSFQIYLDGSPYFTQPLEVENVRHGVYEGFGEFMRQLYQTIGHDLKGDCLIDSTNFQLNFMVGMSFGADKSNTADKHLNLQTTASTYLEIDLGIDVDIPDDLVLIIYATHDRQIQIDSNRMVKIIE